MINNLIVNLLTMGLLLEAELRTFQIKVELTLYTALS